LASKTADKTNFQQLAVVERKHSAHYLAIVNMALTHD
jgi:hypothetical protein